MANVKKLKDEYKYHFKYQMEVTLAKSNRRKRPRLLPDRKIEVFCNDLSDADSIAFRTFLDQNVPEKYHSEATGMILSKEEV